MTTTGGGFLMTSSCFGPGLALGPTQWVRCQISGPRGSQLGLGMAFLGLVWVNLGHPSSAGCTSGYPFFPDGPIYAGKTTFLESKRQLSSVFLTFLGFPWTCLGNSKLDPPKKGCEVDFGRRGKLTCHRIDELFKPNCRTRPSQDPRRPPQTLPGGF